MADAAALSITPALRKARDIARLAGIAAWRGLEGATVVVRGVTYQEAWRAWSSRPLMRTNPFVRFTDRIHAAAYLKEVVRLVGRHAPRWWRPWS